MHRFFITAPAPKDAPICITGQDAIHISRVLRLVEGDEISVCDSEGSEFLCKILSSSPTLVEAKIESTVQKSTEPNVSITLYQGVPKGDKLDFIVQKGVELGASVIVPVDMKRSVAKIKDAPKKKERLSKIAYEATKQCGRQRPPLVMEVMSFSDAIEKAGECELCILCYEEEKSLGIKDVLRKNSDAKSIAILIGPEGGIDPSELEKAKEKGFFSVSMGPRILRTETAPLAAITAVMYEMGDW